MKAGPSHKHQPERTTWADICFGCTCLQLLWPKFVVRKLLNISDRESDYSADTDDSDSANDDSSDWRSKSRLKNSGNGDGADIHPTDTFPRLRRRNSETHRAQFMKTKETKVCIATWNLGGKAPPDDLDIEGWLDTTEPADMYVIGRIIWFGDLNYRINLSYDRTRELISKEDWSKLAESDELKKELKGGGVFDGWSEGTVDFPPTYKYEFNSEKYYGEDPKNGRRTPAWCDRILSYGSGIKLLSYRRTEHTLSDHRPVTASFMVDVEACYPRKLQRALTITDAEMEDQGM